ncbi:MAG TPA: lysylphosphatidylglycerol synthase domain-containing protein [Acetobacteraceae bacterium]|nr:lysylphosphatidylglycerol synthase domain-containing protein [Acetobacteraceae bacterium]
MKQLSYVLALAGVLIGVVLVAYFGVGNVVTAISRIGWPQFALIVGWQLVLFVVLGIAWDIIMPAREGRRFWVPIWGRMVRDAAANCLPFSQVGGFIFGARAVTLQNVEWHTATASTVVDVTAEFLAQIVFACIGLAILILRVPSSKIAGPVEAGIGLAVAACFGFIWVQKGVGSIFARLGTRIAGSRFEDAKERVDVLQAELGLIYGHTTRLAIGVFVHLIGWICTGVACWIGYHALGVPIDFDDAMAIEALLSAAAAVAFLVPVNAGVQEAGYAGLGAVFGVSPELSLGVSLVRRGRDIVVGVPILLLWQAIEMRHLRRIAAQQSGETATHSAVPVRRPGIRESQPME